MQHTIDDHSRGPAWIFAKEPLPEFSSKIKKKQIFSRIQVFKEM